MTNQQRIAAVAIGKATGTGHAPLRWCWPDNKGRFDTRLPVVKRHKNAVKCNYTPLPGSANGRNSRRRRALTANTRRKALTH